MSSWLGASVLGLGEWFIKRMPFVRHIYNASKQISSAVSPGKFSLCLLVVLLLHVYACVNYLLKRQTRTNKHLRKWLLSGILGLVNMPLDLSLQPSFFRSITTTIFYIVLSFFVKQFIHTFIWCTFSLMYMCCVEYAKIGI